MARLGGGTMVMTTPQMMLAMGGGKRYGGRRRPGTLGGVYGGQHLGIPSRPTVPGVPTATAPGTTAFDWEEEARRAVEEARTAQEESKTAALGYYQPIAEKLRGISPELITPAQQKIMLGTRRGELGAYGQNLASLYTDPYSGVQAEQRTQIGMGIAGRQANLPIELQLEIDRLNREATLGLYGRQAEVAGGMAGIEMGYQYDPGLEYIKSLGYGMGYQEATAQQPTTPTLGGGYGVGGGGYGYGGGIPASQLGITGGRATRMAGAPGRTAPYYPKIKRTSLPIRYS